MLDTVRTNERRVFNQCNGQDLSNFEFTWRLRKEVVMLFILISYLTILKRFDGVVLSQEQPVTNEASNASIVGVENTTSSSTRERCKQCRRVVYGNDYADKKNKLNNKSVCYSQGTRAKRMVIVFCLSFFLFHLCCQPKC